jgi:hypothetical protein
MLAKESPEIDYKEVRELLAHRKGIVLKDASNKLTSVLSWTSLYQRSMGFVRSTHG